MTRITFDALFALMAQELPVLNNNAVRDIALVNEYLRTGCATTTPDAALVQSKEMGQDATRKLQE